MSVIPLPILGALEPDTPEMVSAKLMFGKSKVVANASTIFFISRSSSHLLKVSLWSNVKEASLAESFFDPWEYNP